jgi:hypothetical protein
MQAGPASLVLLTTTLVFLLCCSEENQFSDIAIPMPYTTSTPMTSMPIGVILSTPVANSTTEVDVNPWPSSVSTAYSGHTMTASEPKLENLLIKNLGPYDPVDSSFGDLIYDARFGNLVFNYFGMQRTDGHGNQHYNPTFEFRAPADTLLVAPVGGFISYLEWQPSQADWEIHISPGLDSDWRFGIDHIVSLACSRSVIPVDECDLSLKINGSELFEGMPVSAGDLLGYVGTWSDHGNIGINGRTELTVFKYLDGYVGTMNYCPTLFLHEGVETSLLNTVLGLMQSYEDWSGETSTYLEEDMLAPGCLYKTIQQVGDKTKPNL